MSEGALSEDLFLGGKLVIRQPRQGYRAGIDPVLLAAAVSARSGEAVLELGCGVGTAALCLGRRVPGLALYGVEMQPEYAALARQNAAQNSLSMQVFCADLQHMPPEISEKQFHHVLMNPPYYQTEKGTPSANRAREIALFEETPLAAWVDVAVRRTRPRGWITLIQRAERVQEVLQAFDGRVGSVVVKPITGRAGRDASLALVAARKGGRGAFRLAAPLVLHDGGAHPGDHEHYTPFANAIFRDGASLSI
ncbi:MAG: methyltransferase [Rhodobacterales bacterium]|nr:MAG: methyltransferase [Rhodobacterales bacterium]